MPEFFTREIELRAAEADGDLIPCVLASETPVDRGEYLEVLSHSPGDVDLSRAPLPLIVQHDHTKLNVGVIEQIRLIGGKLKGLARFGSSTQAREILADVKSGVVRNLSVGYLLIKSISQSGRTVRFAWMPYECSLVSVPADSQAGFYRSLKGNNIMSEINLDLAENTRSQRRSAQHAINDERDRAADITALGNAHGMPDMALRAIQNGDTVDSFRNIVLQNIKDTGSLRKSELPEIGMTDREAKRFSFRNAIMAQVDPAYGQRYCGLEMEASRAVADKMKREPQGIFVPREVMQARDITVGGGGTGNNLVATDHMASEFIDILRNSSHVMSLGARQFTSLVGNVSIPKQSGSSSVFWVAEGVAVTESTPVFAQLALTPKTVGGFVDYTRKMLLQSSPEIEFLVRRDLAGVIGVEVDRVSINGSGVGAEPLGILNAAGIGAVAIGANGGPITWDHVLQLEETLAVSNADAATIAYLTNPKVRRKLKGTTKVSGDAGAGFIWEAGAGDEPGWGRMNGYKTVGTNNCPSNLTKGTGTNLSAAILGNWSDLIIGQWGALDILVDRTTNGTSGGVRVIALLDTDIGIRNVASFAAIVDATTT